VNKRTAKVCSDVTSPISAVGYNLREYPRVVKTTFPNNDGGR